MGGDYINTMKTTFDILIYSKLSNSIDYTHKQRKQEKLKKLLFDYLKINSKILLTIKTSPSRTTTFHSEEDKSFFCFSFFFKSFIIKWTGLDRECTLYLDSVAIVNLTFDYIQDLK